MRKRINPKLSAELAAFVKQYARKAQRGIEPNDRGYDRKMEKLMKSLSPEDLSAILNEDEAAKE